MSNTEKMPENQVSVSTAELTQAELDKVAGGGTVSSKPNPIDLPLTSSRSDGGGATVGRAN